MPQKTPNYPEGFQQSICKGQVREGRGGCCRLLGVGILCSCSCPRMSAHNVPVNLQQDERYSLFCNFLFLYEWKSVIPLRVRALRMGAILYISGSRQHS